MLGWIATLLLILAGLLPAAAGLPEPTVAAQATPTADGYAHPEWLADAAWLRDRLGDPGIKVVALTPSKEFAAGHIPGAAQIDWPDLEIVDTADPSIARWQGEVEAKLTALGLAPTDTVVVYDGGTLYAPRLWWVLIQLGHVDARVLNGGFPAWEAAGGEVETGPSRAEPAASPYVGKPDASAVATIAEVRAAYDDPGVTLIDARSPQEYADGHIPGAVNIEFVQNNAPDQPRYWKSAAELRAMYEAAGVTPDRTIIPYCLTGVRSANTYFTLRLLGYEDVSLFTGSWKEWSNQPDLPRATGSEP